MELCPITNCISSSLSEVFDHARDLIPELDLGLLVMFVQQQLIVQLLLDLRMQIILFLKQVIRV
jgi:hypothetical protein